MRVAGRPKRWAMATMAINLRVLAAIICDPLSDTASSSGVKSSSPSRTSRCWKTSARSSAEMSRSSASRACSRREQTWRWVSTWVIHLRETRSSMISTVIAQVVKWVES